MKAIASGEMNSSPLRCFCWPRRPEPMNVALTAKGRRSLERLGLSQLGAVRAASRRCDIRPGIPRHAWRTIRCAPRNRGVVSALAVNRLMDVQVV